MPVIGFNLNSIKADVENRTLKGGLDISSTPNIKKIEKRTVLDMDVLSIGFVFETKYSPDVATITIEGELIYKTDDMKKILKTWKDEKKLHDDAAAEVLNIFFRRCLTKAIALSEDINMPPPIGFPLVKPKED